MDMLYIRIYLNQTLMKVGCSKDVQSQHEKVFIFVFLYGSISSYIL